MIHKILSIDDDRFNRILLEKILENKYTIYSLADGNSLIRNIRELNPDVILLDIMMPSKDGFECILEIKQYDDLKDIPIIMVTALIDHDNIKKSLELGAFDYIKKPVISYELLSKIDNAISYKINIDKIKICNDVYSSLLEAKRIQDSILPSVELKNQIFKNCKILSLPKDVVSGDLYWYNQIDNKKYLFLGDCIGHGIPGSMLTVMILTILKNIDYTKRNTREILQRISYNIKNIIANKDSYTVHDSLDAALLIIEDFDDNVNIEFSSSRIDLLIISKNNNIIINDEIISPYISNNDFYLYRVLSECTSLDRMSVDIDFFINNIKLNKGDRIFLWTDGLSEQIGINDENKMKKYSKRKFIEFLLKKQKYNLDNITNLVSEEFYKWKLSIEQFDDLTFIGIEL